MKTGTLAHLRDDLYRGLQDYYSQVHPRTVVHAYTRQDVFRGDLYASLLSDRDSISFTRPPEMAFVMTSDPPEPVDYEKTVVTVQSTRVETEDSVWIAAYDHLNDELYLLCEN